MHQEQERSQTCGLLEEEVISRYNTMEVEHLELLLFLFF